jgi:L-malate glycosyltransferase
MKLLVLNYEFPPIGGGAANALHEILNQYKQHKDLEIDLITSSEKKKNETMKFSENINIYKVNVNKKQLHYWTALEIYSYTVRALSLAQQQNKEKKYDLCHCFFALPCGIIPYFLKIPYIVSLRGSDVPGFNKRLNHLSFIQSFVSGIIWKKAKFVVANSEGLKELALNTRKEQDIKIIYNGIDTDMFYPKEKVNDNITHITLLCVSRLIPRKGLEYLIKAMPKIIEKRKDTKLIIIGDGPEKARLKQLSVDLGVDKNIELHGYVPHEKLPQIYRSADIFILPSLYEGMSNTILEAMASGLPIITTNTGGTKELIKGNGMIIKKKSSKDISDSVAMLLEDNDKISKFSKKSRELALENDWKSAAEQYLRLYESVK